MSNAWKAVIDADLKDADFAPRENLPDGEYPAFVGNIEAKTFESKSKGLQITYIIAEGSEHKGREIRDWYVIVDSTGQPNKRGPAQTKRLLMAAGLSADDIHKFRFPDFDSKAFGDFKKVLEQPVTISVQQQLQKKGKNAGKTFSRVEGVKLRDAE